MFKYLLIGGAMLMLSACNGAVLPPPPSTLPAPPTELSAVDNTELCTAIKQNEAHLQLWLDYGRGWARIFGVDLDAKIAEFTGDIEVLKDAAEARDVACQ